MDLKVEDVARLLRVSEDTIHQWVQDDAIPSYEINGIHLFSRQEVEAWMMEQQINRDLVTDGQGATGIHQYGLFRALHRGGVCRDVPGATKEEVIRNTMKVVARKFDLDDSVLTDLLLDREQLQPTSLGHGLGIPHTRDFLLNAHYDIVTVVFPEKPIEDYGALDGKPVHTLLFLFACEDQRHLNLLAKIAHMASQPSMLKLLETKPDKETLLQEVKGWEGSLAQNS